MKSILYTIVLSLCLLAQNPEMKGFKTESSDQKAIKIADEVMEALGGYENWNNTQYIAWNFFGRRMHYWNKWTGDYRLEFKDNVIIMNLNSKKTKLYMAGKEITSTDSLAKYSKYANSTWINDSYWMFMPYKLKDTGVTLKYLSEGKMADGKVADILQLTFENIGDTPENKYHIYVNKESHMVEQWDYFSKFSDEKARFTTAWHNWKQFGKIMLSDDRGRGKHTNLAVFESFDKKLFNSSTMIDFNSLVKISSK